MDTSMPPMPIPIGGGARRQVCGHGGRPPVLWAGAHQVCVCAGPGMGRGAGLIVARSLVRNGVNVFLHSFSRQKSLEVQLTPRGVLRWALNSRGHGFKTKGGKARQI